VVQKLMRHGSLETIAAYTAADEDELRDAVKLLWCPGLDPMPAEDLSPGHGHVSALNIWTVACARVSLRAIAEPRSDPAKGSEPP
jgi:hypothetical protein